MSPPARAISPSRTHHRRPAEPHGGGVVDSLTPHLYLPTPERPLRAKMRHLRAETKVVPHHHEWPQLTFSLNGVCRLSTDNGTFIVPPSRAVWVPAGISHSITVVEDADLHTLYLHPAAAPTVPPWQGCVVIEVSELMRALVLSLNTHSDTQIERIDPDAQAALLHREHLIQPLLCDELLRAPQIRMGVPLPPTDSGDKRLRALCEAVLRAPAERATLADWSARVGASERTVARLFREQLGLSYQQWRQQATLAHALPLLARGQPVSLVAAASGYASESAFTAMFRAAMGQPPSHFQSKARQQAST